MESPEENHIGILGAAGFLGRRLAARLLLHGRSFSCFDINTASEVGTTSYLDIECISDLRPLEGINTLVI